MYLRRILITLFLGVLSYGIGINELSAQSSFEDRYEIVDGWAVHGYADNIRIGYQWFRTKGEAVKEREKMLKIETTNGKYYDRVDIKSERRKIYRPRPERRPPPENTLPAPSRARPGNNNGGGAANAKPKTLDVTGYESLGGYGRVRFRLTGGNRAIMMDKDGQTPGTWSINGNQVRMSFYGGKVVYTGTIQGNRISGSARNGSTSWTWSVTIAK